MAVTPVPPGYHTITPYLIVDGAAAALELYRRARHLRIAAAHLGPPHFSSPPAAPPASRLPPPASFFYGDRSGTVVDPFGHRWTLATHVEDVAPDELGRRMAQYTKSQGG